VAEGSVRKHPDVGGEHAHIACTRSTETIRMQNKEEIGLLLLGVIEV
jgi:hypothetical protein